MKTLTAQDPPAPERAGPAGARRRLWPLATAAALVLVSLAVAFALLLTARKKTLDALVVVTLPSGAEVVFDGVPLGPAPVKLEDVRIGRHTVRVTKDGFVPVEQHVELDADRDAPLEFDLKPVAPPGSVARTPAEQVQEFTGLAEDALARGDLVVPSDRSALYYAEAILSLDRANRYARELRERIRDELHAAARAAAREKDLARAKDAYEQLVAAFPDEGEGARGLASVIEQLRRDRTRLKDVLSRAEAAMRAGRLIEPPGRSAYAYAARALAIDPDDPQAAALRRRVRDRAVEAAEALAADGRVEEAADMYGRLVALFPEDRAVRVEFDRLMAGEALDALRSHRDAGLRAYRAGSYRAAVEHLQAAVRLGAADSETRTALGISHLRLGEPARARRELERSVVQDGAQADALAALGELAARDGDARRALDYLRRARRLGGRDEAERERLDALIEDLERRLGGDRR
jgi:tetratricopeptide (TPR) repeat protein